MLMQPSISTAARVRLRNTAGNAKKLLAATLGSRPDALQAKRVRSGRPVVVDLGVDLTRPNRGKLADPVVYCGEPGNGSPRSVGLRRECDQPVYRAAVSRST